MISSLTFKYVLAKTQPSRTSNPLFAALFGFMNGVTAIFLLPPRLRNRLGNVPWQCGHTGVAFGLPLSTHPGRAFLQRRAGRSPRYTTPASPTPSLWEFRTWKHSQRLLPLSLKERDPCPYTSSGSMPCPQINCKFHAHNADSVQYFPDTYSKSKKMRDKRIYFLSQKKTRQASAWFRSRVNS